MFVAALVLTLIGVLLIALALRVACRALDCDLREMLLWLGLAEVPSDPALRRSRPARV